MHSGNSIDVIVWTAPDDCESGILRILNKKLLIELESGKKITSPSNFDIQYAINAHRFDANIRIIFNPVFIVSRQYSPYAGQVVEGVFPPSSSGFYGRMRIGEKDADFIVQEILDSEKFFLIIGNLQTGDIFDTITIHPYEAEALQIFDNYELQQLWDLSFWPADIDSVKEDIFNILDEPSLSWTEVSRLVEDISIPDLTIGKTMRETLTQLIPSSFPDDIRNELMTFLAFISKDVTMKEDPIDFYFRTYPLRMLGALIRGHLRCIIDKRAWPSYVKLMIQASRGHLQPPIKPLDEQSKDVPWNILWNKLFEIYPSWLDISINSAKELNKSGKILLRLPSTKSSARKSRKLWKTRLAALSYGLRVQGNVDVESIGLTDLLYLGAAYRWPHRHMKFISRLGPLSESPQHLQIMTMPNSSVERVKRFLPSTMKITWSTRVVNLDLFNATSGNWEIPSDRIIDSTTRGSSLKKLINRFGSKEKVDAYQMSIEDAKVTGLISDGIFLSDFEHQGYFDFWGLSKKKFQSVLSNLVKHNVIKLAYDVLDGRLVSVATIVQGSAKHLTSLADAFLRYTPTSLVFLNEDGDRGVFLSRLTEESAFEIASKLPGQGLQNSLNIRCMRPMAFRSFTYNLYYRLLKDNGSWDDDVTAFLSQARSKRKEMSESNA